VNETAPTRRTLPGPAAETPPAPVARLAEDLRSLDRAYSRGHHGRWSARRRAGLVDDCLVALFRGEEAPGGVALVALGGYGRGELAPASDVDLLLLHELKDPGTVREVAERLLYPMWDAGFELGHGVRTPKESLALAAERLDAATAMLDARLLDGDGELFASFRERLSAWARKPATRLPDRLRSAAEERRRRFGSASQRLEPDVKEGSGGLRDVHTLGWLAAAVGDDGGGGLDAVVELQRFGGVGNQSGQ
jgi:[protein-PII] uridylyltransferase